MTHYLGLGFLIPALDLVRMVEEPVGRMAESEVTGRAKETTDDIAVGVLGGEMRETNELWVETGTLDRG